MNLKKIYKEKDSYVLESDEYKKITVPNKPIVCTGFLPNIEPVKELVETVCEHHETFLRMSEDHQSLKTPGLFFAGVTYALNSFNEETDMLYILRGSLEMGRAATSDVIIMETSTGAVDDSVKGKVSLVAQSYGIDFNPDEDIQFYSSSDPLTSGNANPCKEKDYQIKHLVPVFMQGGSIDNIQLEQLIICVRKMG